MVFGAVVLLTAWLPMVLRELPLSLPIACIALGVGLSWSVLSPLVAANPLADIEVTRRLTEFVVIVALFGAGLKIDRPISWRGWILVAFALGQAEFERPDTLWVTVCLVVLVSIVLHGVTVTPAMRLLDRQRRSGREE